MSHGSYTHSPTRLLDVSGRGAGREGPLTSPGGLPSQGRLCTHCAWVREGRPAVLGMVPALRPRSPSRGPWCPGAGLGAAKGTEQAGRGLWASPSPPFTDAGCPVPTLHWQPRAPRHWVGLQEARQPSPLQCEGLGAGAAAPGTQAASTPHPPQNKCRPARGQGPGRWTCCSYSACGSHRGAGGPQPTEEPTRGLLRATQEDRTQVHWAGRLLRGTRW